MKSQNYKFVKITPDSLKILHKTTMYGIQHRIS